MECNTNNIIKINPVGANMLKKSWTTSNIATALELETKMPRGDIKVLTSEHSRNLMREYLEKAIDKIPEILKIQEGPCHCITFSEFEDNNEINLAYKHPLVIAEEIERDAGEALAYDSLCNNIAVSNNPSIIVPQQRDDNAVPKRPHLIRKVTPGIAKTWEQLSYAINGSSFREISDIERHDDEEKQSFVLFLRKPFNFCSSETNENDFAVKKIQHTEDSEEFYDSIEDYDDDYEEEIDDVECDLEYDKQKLSCASETVANHMNSNETRKKNFKERNDHDTSWTD